MNRHLQGALWRIVCTYLQNIGLKIKYLHYTRGITPKRVTKGGIHLRGLAPEQHATKKHRSGGALLAALCSIQPARESNPDLQR